MTTFDVFQVRIASAEDSTLTLIPGTKAVFPIPKQESVLQGTPRVQKLAALATAH